MSSLKEGDWVRCKFGPECTMGEDCPYDKPARVNGFAWTNGGRYCALVSPSGACQAWYADRLVKVDPPLDQAMKALQVSSAPEARPATN